MSQSHPGKSCDTLMIWRGLTLERSAAIVFSSFTVFCPLKVHLKPFCFLSVLLVSASQRSTFQLSINEDVFLSVSGISLLSLMESRNHTVFEHALHCFRYQESIFLDMLIQWEVSTETKL